MPLGLKILVIIGLFSYTSLLAIPVTGVSFSYILGLASHTLFLWAVWTKSRKGWLLYLIYTLVATPSVVYNSFEIATPPGLSSEGLQVWAFNKYFIAAVPVLLLLYLYKVRGYFNK